MNMDRPYKSERGAIAKHLGLAVFVIIVISILALVALPNFLGSRSRPSVSRVRADLRSVATAIENYYVDRSTFPAWSARQDANIFSKEGREAKFADGLLPTFALLNPAGPQQTLTTPIAYLISYPSDPFAPAAGIPFCYWTDKSGWIMWSAGPDRKYDLTIDNIGLVYHAEDKVPSDLLIMKTYDPSNGPGSPGDIYRTKD